MALALLARLWAARALVWSESAGISRTFNPTEYPRTYAVAASREPNFIRLSVWMLLLGGASTWVFAHGDSPDMLQQQIVLAGCVMVGLTGALMIFSRFTARVVLEPDGVAVRALVGGAAMKRHDILGVREYQRGKGPRLIELVPPASRSGAAAAAACDVRGRTVSRMVRFPAAPYAAGRFDRARIANRTVGSLDGWPRQLARRKALRECPLVGRSDPLSEAAISLCFRYLRSRPF